MKLIKLGSSYFNADEIVKIGVKMFHDSNRFHPYVIVKSKEDIIIIRDISFLSGADTDLSLADQLERWISEEVRIQNVQYGGLING